MIREHGSGGSLPSVFIGENDRPIVICLNSTVCVGAARREVKAKIPGGEEASKSVCCNGRDKKDCEDTLHLEKND